MGFLEKIKPAFWDVRPPSPSARSYLFNYRRIWKWSVLLTGLVALVPLVFITLVDYKVTENSFAQEFRLRAARAVSNTWRAIGFSLSERQAALAFIVQDNPPQSLKDAARLNAILEHLKKSFGGSFMDLGIIGADGRQISYVGPFELQNADYHDQPWFKMVVDRGVYISDVFLGFRQVPHLVIAVKQDLPDGSFQILRASLGIKHLEALLSDMELGGLGEAFIVNERGILQTYSRYYGKVLDQLSLPIPQYYPSTEVMDARNPQGEKLLIGYRFIDGTPFILMVIKKEHELMQPWRSTRLKLILFLVGSVTLILAVILGTATYMVRNIHLADEKRLMSLHQVEYSNKLASIGRMAAGVAHEINNPLAIINEKAGLIKDLFTLKKEYQADEKLIGLVEAINHSVQRAGRITKRLLTFARNFESSIARMNLEEVVREVLSFVEKEAQMRSIQIKVEAAAAMPLIETDRGKLQQIFLNIFNNAFAAMKDEGHLQIHLQPDPGYITVRICDNGCGIPPEDLHRIFEPFFSTKTGQGGTGLGLSITYNLVHEIGGEITVASQVGSGTCFTIRLPFCISNPKGQEHAGIIGG